MTPISGETRWDMTAWCSGDVRKALEKPNTDACRAVLNNADLFALFVGVVNGSLAALEGAPSAALGFADKWATVADASGKMTNNKTLRAAAGGTQILTQSLSLMKLGANATPGAVMATVGAMFTKKVALAFGLAEDDKRAKIIAAVADVTSSVLAVGAIGLATTATPGILIVAAYAQLGVSGYQAYTAMVED
jgi:hypothetical protein